MSWIGSVLKVVGTVAGGAAKGLGRAAGGISGGGKSGGEIPSVIGGQHIGIGLDQGGGAATGSSWISQLGNLVSGSKAKSAAGHVGSFLQGSGESLLDSMKDPAYMSRTWKDALFGNAPPPSWQPGIQQYLSIMTSQDEQQQIPLD